MEVLTVVGEESCEEMSFDYYVMEIFRFKVTWCT